VATHSCKVKYVSMYEQYVFSYLIMRRTPDSFDQVLSSHHVYESKTDTADISMAKKTVLVITLL
jgi:hypothetical protein